MKGVSSTSAEHVAKTLKMMQWALSNGYCISPKAGEVAARGGHLEMLKWLKENDCLGYKEVYVAAAKGGHLEVLKWLGADGWSSSKDVFAAAAKGGHLEILNWLEETDCDEDIFSWSRGNYILEFIISLFY
jgi:hypothetical protein